MAADSRFVGVEIEGAKQLRKIARDAGDREARRALSAGHKAAADIVATRAKDHVPYRSGALYGSIRPSGTLSAASVRAGSASVPYAGPIHYGWPARNIEPNMFIAQAVGDKLGDVRDAIETLYRAVASELKTTTRG